LVDSKDKSEDEDQEPTRIQVCFCSIWENIVTKYASVRPKNSRVVLPELDFLI
jgi:hypothetical protein